MTARLARGMRTVAYSMGSDGRPLFTRSLVPSRTNCGGLRSISRLRCASHLGCAIVVTCVVSVAGCGGGAPNGIAEPVVSAPVLAVLKVSLTPDTLLVGQSTTASASGLDQNSAPISIDPPAWSTTSPGVATVSPGGVVSAVAPGQTMLIASANGKQGQRTLTIVQPQISRISIAPDQARLARGATLQLAAIALDYNGRVLPNRRIDWTTSDAAKATVTSAGVVTAVSPGVVTIIATGEGVSASDVVTVTNFADSVVTVKVSPAAANLAVGGSLQLAATLMDAAGNTMARAMTWSATAIAGANVATVSAAGLVTAVSPGTVIIEAFSEGQHGAATITVNDVFDTNIVVSFAGPALNELVGDTLLVIVGVKALDPLVTVIASVGSIQTTLVLTHVGFLGGSILWVGSLDITDLPSGPYQVVVTATDVHGARGMGAIQFQRDTRVGKGGSVAPPKMR